MVSGSGCQNIRKSGLKLDVFIRLNSWFFRPFDFAQGMLIVNKHVWKNKANRRALPGNPKSEYLNPKQFDGWFEKTKPICAGTNQRKFLFERDLWRYAILRTAKKQSQFKANFAPRTAQSSRWKVKSEPDSCFSKAWCAIIPLLNTVSGAILLSLP